MKSIKEMIVLVHYKSWTNSSINKQITNKKQSTYTKIINLKEIIIISNNNMNRYMKYTY